MINILIDLESTGLLSPEEAPLDQQPYITEICCWKYTETDSKNVILDQFSSLIKPPVPVSQEVSKLTGIYDSLLVDQPTFIEILPELAAFWIGSEKLIAHNVSFDKTLLKIELKRVGREFNFPWTPDEFCTSEYCHSKYGEWTNLGKWYEKLTGEKVKETHRAEADVRTLFACCTEAGLI